MTSTRTYVNDKLQPVQAGVSSAVNVVSGATDMLLNNRLGRLTLNSVEFTIASVHECIDYFIPPIAGDTVTASNYTSVTIFFNKFVLIRYPYAFF